MPTINTRQVVWQPVTDNGDLAMRLAPIDWQPSGAHACIQMLADDLRDAEAKLVTAVEALREIEVDCDADYPASHGAIKHAVRAVLAELEGEKK